MSSAWFACPVCCWPMPAGLTRGSPRSWAARRALSGPGGAGSPAAACPPWLARGTGRLAIVAAATSVPPEDRPEWTHAMIAAEPGGTGISASQAGRILADMELRPHKVRGRLRRADDAQFWAQAAAVCDAPVRVNLIAAGRRPGRRPVRRSAPGPGHAGPGPRRGPCRSQHQPCRSPPLVRGERAGRRSARPVARPAGHAAATATGSAGLAGHYHLGVARPVPEDALGRTVREQRPHFPGEAVKTITKEVRRRG